MIRLDLLLLSLSVLHLVQCYTSTTYSLVKDFQAGTSNFWYNFDWFTGPDPTHGFVQYQSYPQAAGLGMAWWKNGVSYFGADKYSKAPSGRKSVRLESKAVFTEVLIIADITHLPGGVCGIWPAFWTANLTQWPNGGEIDIIEGVNKQWYNHYALHTTPTCIQQGQSQSGKVETANCDNNAAGQWPGQGCGGSAATSFGTYGFPWNAQGGGVYALDWRKEGIRIWAFPRKAIPTDITSGNPTVTGWGLPMVDLPNTGCNIPAHFYNHKIIFDITFCGDWAGAVYSTSGCPGTCTDQVANNPSDYVYSYFGVQSLKVYKSTKPV